MVHLRVEEEEVIVGRHESGILLEEGMNTSTNRNYCTKCKRNIHCRVVVKDGEAIIKKTCSNDDCECKCKTHYACKRCGYLHSYGKECNRMEENRKIDPKSEKKFNELMKKWRKQTDKDIVKVEKKDGR